MPSAQYQAAVQQVRSRLLKFGDLLWQSLPGYGDADLDQLVSQLAPRVQAGQVQIATLTAADIAQQLGVRPTIVDRRAMTDVRGVPDDALYSRPIVTVRTELSRDATIAAARESGRIRMASLIATGLQMAKVRQADTSLRSAGVTAYRRVLVGAENCALCTIASTQRYHVGNLMPIHPGCNCDVEQIASNTELPQVIEPDLLEDAHARIGEITGAADRGGRNPDYRKLLLVREHGEIGPVLTWRGDKFTSFADLPKG